jgi:hypothetical protein
VKKLIKKFPPIEEDLSLPKKDKFMWIRLPYSLNIRFIRQCKRLHCGASVLARMAVVKFVEEEEARERALSEAHINL